MDNITRRDYFAIMILQKLMDRWKEKGYSEAYAISEACRLADLMIQEAGMKNGWGD